MAEAYRVLIVEDDLMVAAVHQAFTQRLAGFAVCAVAHTGEEALAALEREQPDLVLLDVYLPDISGLDVLRETHRRGLPADVILITAARDVDSVREAVRGGAVHYIVKPFQFAKFKSTLQDYARLRQRLRRSGAVDQAAIDQIYARTAPPAETDLPKGLSRATLDHVIAVLGEAPGPVTADALAGSAGVTRVTARRYLEYLTAVGRARRSLRYGVVGRPEHCYHLLEG